MPWPDPDRIRAAWPSTEGVPLSCFVYGQGFCGSDQSYFPDFEKRALIASWLTEEELTSASRRLKSLQGFSTSSRPRLNLRLTMT